jgi:hypothetical protein
MSTIASDLKILQDHWQTVLLVLGIVSSVASTAATALTPYPKIETALTKFIGILSWAQHQDVRGWSIPGVPLQKPGATKTISTAGGAAAAIVVLALASYLVACAALKPLPTQSLNCLASQAPGTLSTVGTALATHEAVADMEAGLAADGLSALWCIASAAYQDLRIANQIAAQTGVPTVTVQAHAKVYLQSKS